MIPAHNKVVSRIAILKKLVGLIFVVVFMATGIPAKCEVKLAIVPGGDPKPDALLALAEAKLFELKNVALLERAEIDKVLAEQKLTGMFNATNAVELGQILKVDLFAVLETTSIVIFDAQTGLRFVDETLPEQIEDAAKAVADAVTTAVEKRQKLDQGKIVTFGVLEVRNADFPVERDAWCRAVAGMLERSLLHRGGAVLERSRLQLVNQERNLTGDSSNDLLASMKLIDLEFTRGETVQSFKITARIGDQTLRAESPIDKPLDVVQAIAGQLLESKNVAETSRETEAARFAEEAAFLDKLGFLDETIDKIEVAVLLQPENVDFQRQLFFALRRRAYIQLVLRNYAGDRFVYDGRLRDYRIDAETMRHRVHDLLRLESLMELFPPGHNDRFTRDQNFALILRHLANQAKLFHPEFKDKLRLLNLRIIDHWLDEVYRPALNRVVDHATFQNYLRGVYAPPSCRHETADCAAGYTEIMEDMLRLSREYDVVNIDHNDSGNIYWFNSCLWNFATFVQDSRAANIAETDPEAAAMIERILVMMEQDSRMISRVYAWIARNRPVGNYDTVDNLLNVMECYSVKVHSYLAGLPKGLAFHDYNPIYDELTSIIRATNGLQSDPNFIPHKPSILSQYAEIIQLADSRNEFARDAVSFNIGMLYSIAQADENTFAMRAHSGANKADFMKLKPHIDPVILRQLALAESLNIGKTVVELRKRANWAGITESPDSTVAARPWNSEITLLSKEDGCKNGHGQPLIRGHLLYYTMYKSDEKGFFSPMITCVNLKTREKQYIPVPDVYLPGSGKITHSFQYVDQDNIYFGFRNNDGVGGLLVCPLDGSKSWSLTTDDGLPDYNIRIMGTLDGRCYAVIRRDWIIQIDVKSRQWELLSSSRAKDGKTPFVNGRQLPLPHTFEDTKRERILLMQSDRSPPTEFWAIEKDGQFLPININNKPLDHVDDKMELLLLGVSHIYDNDSSTVFPLKFGMFNACAWNGYVWGCASLADRSMQWGRQRIDVNSEAESLAIPEEFAPFENRAFNSLDPKFNNWNPRFCIPAPEENGLIISDGQSIVLLRFDNPSTNASEP